MTFKTESANSIEVTTIKNTVGGYTVSAYL